MLEKVKEIERKYLGIEAELAQPETYADIERCAALNKELTELKRLVMEIDPNAFVILQDAHQVLGDGFARHTKDSL